jgi:hypothetical protein
MKRLVCIHITTKETELLPESELSATTLVCCFPCVRFSLCLLILYTTCNMNTVPVNEKDPRIQKALTELKQMIQQRWHDAVFTTERGFDPEGIYLIATVDVEDTDIVMEAIVGRLVELQVEEGLPVYVHVEPSHRPQAHLG